MYNFQQPLFWYKLLFMAQLLVAEFMFAYRLTRRKHFTLRLFAGLIMCFAAAFAFPLLPEISYTSWYSIVLFLSLFAVSIASLALMFQAPPKDIIFCAIAAYTVQHIAQEIYELLNILLNLNGKLTSDFYGSHMAEVGGLQWFIYIIYNWIYLMVYWAAYVLFSSRERQETRRIKNYYLIIIAGVLILIDVIFSSIVTYSIPEDTSTVPVLITHLYNICSCVLTLFLLFEFPRRMNAENELAIVRQIRYSEKRQYFSAKENIDLINMKCHDLKHQIRKIALNKAHDGDMISEIENVISVYDASYRTDNDALDVILTEKSLMCQKLKIKLSCIVDGAKLGFMKDTDVYALFGNMLDNAIEAVSKFDESCRSVGISVKSINNFLIINIRNNYDGNILFNNNLPVTSKTDRDFHGFGMKSIQYVVNKYDGQMTIKTSGSIFNLNIAFPL